MLHVFVDFDWSIWQTLWKCTQIFFSSKFDPDPKLSMQCFLKMQHASLRWRGNGRDSVSNHQPHDCLLNRLFRRRSKKTSELRVTGLCARNSPGTGEFPAQMASNAENVSIWWRHHVMSNFLCHARQPTTVAVGLFYYRMHIFTRNNCILGIRIGTEFFLIPRQLSGETTVCCIYGDQAPVPLAIFRSNSKFYQNLPCSGLKCTLPITTKFCTHHDNVTVVTCANFAAIGYVYSKLELSRFWSNLEFDRNIGSGTGACWIP